MTISRSVEHAKLFLTSTNLMRVQLKNDNVQDFDTKCDEVLLSMAKVPEKDTLEIFVQKQLQYLEELKPLTALQFARYSARKGALAGCLSTERNGSPSCRAKHLNARNEGRTLPGSAWKRTKKEILKAMERIHAKTRKMDIALTELNDQSSRRTRAASSTM